MQGDSARLTPAGPAGIGRPVHRARSGLEQFRLLEIERHAPCGKNLAATRQQTTLDPRQTATQPRHIGRRELFFGVENFLQNTVGTQPDRAPCPVGTLHARQAGEHPLTEAAGQNGLVRPAGPNLRLPQDMEWMPSFRLQGQGFGHDPRRTGPLSLCNPPLLVKFKS